ncbi:MAG: hypothetical protein ABW148_18605 [Sedimenticola sp.]
MNKKHKIEISNLFNDRNKSQAYVRENVRNFMSWLISEGHTVSYSDDMYTIVDGKNIMQDELTFEIYQQLADKYLDSTY